ncbi:methyltransferase domain-containing protein [Isachenkonia alkalipeptolytica]|uniref:Methyltransferase domain-containing protein n=1 Tax=Isachenkonia alkalipeptolytica TaxID=2565777 RepID=A0AA43XKQ1_9CLOT|nr:methyltransferase domain-containing protein [Isachenkonia alkalipeptolytica]
MGDVIKGFLSEDKDSLNNGCSWIPRKRFFFMEFIIGQKTKGRRERMDRDLSYWKERWRKEEGERERCDQQGFWDNRADFFNGKVFTEEKLGSEIVNHLKSKNMLTRDMEVLDIGCGPGKHTLPLAREVKRVTALDISENMLEHLRKNMKKTKLFNIDPLHLDWKDGDLKKLHWEKAFDLVFASMTPGVFNYETLEKMVKAGKQYAYLSGFVKRKDEVGDEIFRFFERSHGVSAKKQNKVYYAFNILWQWGYTPEVEYIHRTWEDEFTSEEAYALYRDKLAAVTTLLEEDREKIKEILKSFEKEGKITEKTEVTQGLLTWKL